MLTPATALAGAGILYVDDDAPPGGNGSSWTMGFRYLQDALIWAASPAHGIGEIRVAQGAYLPDRYAAFPLGTGLRTSTFQLLNGITLNGGYAGIGAADPDARDPDAYETRLSGDLDGNDVPGSDGLHPSAQDNAYHVVTASGVGPTAVIDGFIIQSGKTEPGGSGWVEFGGGMLTIGGSPFVSDCRFTLNWGRYGAGMYSGNGSHPVLLDCLFLDNDASDSGGGIRSENGCSLVLTGCTFDSNTAQGSGGGVMSFINCSLSATNCQFIANRTISFNSAGGGIRNENSGTAIVTNCTFSANECGSGGGGAGMLTQNGSSSTVTGCTFTSNVGGGAAALTVPPGGVHLVANCQFIDNFATQSGGALGVANNDAVIENCTFEQNQSLGGGGAVVVGNYAPTIRDCTFTGNTGSSRGGAIYIENGDPYLVRCSFQDNTAADGGALYAYDGAKPWVVNCSFLGNEATFFAGGAVYNERFSDAQYVNCLFSGNLASRGAAMANGNESDVVLTNCTFSENLAALQGGGVFTLQLSTTTAGNSIFWGNSDSSGEGQDAQLRNDGATTFINFCCVQGLTGSLGGLGNIGDDPGFVDPDGLDDQPGTPDDDLRLTSGSPAVNTADSTLLPADLVDLDDDDDLAEPTPFDLDGMQRVVGGAVDIGTYESTESSSAGLYVGPPGGSWFNPESWQGGAVPGPGTVVVVRGAVVVDQSGATAAAVGVQAGGSLTIAAGSLTTTSLTAASGGTLIMANVDAVLNVNTVTFEVGALLQWNAGRINLAGSWTTPSAITMGCAGSATLALGPAGGLSTPALTICAAGEVIGSGSISAAVSNNGAIRPGPGTAVLTVNGSYTQGSRGLLDLELASYGAAAPRDLLAVIGSAALDGTLAITVLDGSSPQIFARKMLQAGSLSGQFAAVTQPDPLGDGLAGWFQTGSSFWIGMTAPGPRLYVNAAATPGGLGTSWSQAAADLQLALLAARLSGGGIQELWVSAGTYVPSFALDSTDPRVATFDLVSGASAYGGFAGGETSLAQRDPLVNVTILSGDVMGDDGPGFGLGDNVHHVVSALDLAAPATMDGFTIRAGFASGAAFPSGAGLRIANVVAPLALRQLAFVANIAPSNGAAIHASQASFLSIENCTFVDNDTLARGGAIYAQQAGLALSDCLFESNSALVTGGAVATVAVASATFDNCQFLGNTGGNNGGALRFESASNATLQDCVLDGNSADLEGGAVSSSGGSVTVITSLFRDNSVGIRGGAVHAEGSQARLTSCRFFSNESFQSGGAFYIEVGSTVQLIGCVLDANYALRYGGGVYVIGSTISVANCTVAGNVADLFEGGGLYFTPGITSVIVNSILWGNSASEGLMDETAQIFGQPTLLASSCIQGLSLLSGSNNIGADPRFADADGTDDVPGTLDDDLTLFFNSPCIDAANNALLLADLDDLDGDGDAAEPLPLDVAGGSRRIDDPLTPDTGLGSAPIVDMGAHEFGPVCSTCAGPRLWINPLGGSFASGGNWFPSIPAPTDGVIFNLDASYAVSVPDRQQNDFMLIADGSVTLQINGSYALNIVAHPALMIGVVPNQPASLSIAGGTLSAPAALIQGHPSAAGSSGSLTVKSTGVVDIAGAMALGEDAAGTITVEAGGAVHAEAGLLIGPHGLLEGGGLVAATVVNDGIVDPGGAAPATLSIVGSYQQSPIPTGGGQAGMLRVDLAGPVAGVDHDVLSIDGEASLGGTLIVTLAEEFSPSLGQSFTILTADSLIDAFDLSFLPAMPVGLALTVQYSDEAVTLVVVEFDVDFFSFADPLVIGGFDPPRDAVLTDVDNDGDQDAVLVVHPPLGPGLPPPGSILVFRNLGLGPGSQWLGFEPTPDEIPVGVVPLSVAAGFFNADNLVDLAVVNGQFGSISIMINDPRAPGSFSQAQLLSVPETGFVVAAGPLYAGSRDDVVVISGFSRLYFFRNNGTGAFTHEQIVNVGGNPKSLAVADLTGDGQVEVASAGYGATFGKFSTVTIVRRDEGTGLFAALPTLPTGDAGTLDIIAVDVTGDGSEEVVTADEVGGTSSIFTALVPGSLLFGAPSVIQAGPLPSSLQGVDLDADEDIDLAIVAENESGQRVIRLKRNDALPGAPINFTDASPLLTGGSAAQILAGDLNGDDVPDLIALNSDTPEGIAGGAGSLSILVNQTAELVLGDLNGDGTVNGFDLAILLAAWGPCRNCPEDLNENGIVNGFDLAILLAQWSM